MKEIVLAFKYLDLNCRLDFGEWAWGKEDGEIHTIVLLLMAY